MTHSRKLIKVGIIAYPQAQLAAIEGLVDLFRTATTLGDKFDGPEIVVTRIKTDTDLPHTDYAALILPPSLDTYVSPPNISEIKAWFVKQHAHDTLLCSICTGAFLLAETGLLEGREVTTHWALVKDFSQRYPDIQVNPDRLIIEYDDMITAGGLMAWIDLGLCLVERFANSQVMIATAHYLLVDPGGREQRYYSRFAPSRRHGDEHVMKVQTWLNTNSEKNVTIPQMAKIAGLSERTFLRRFNKATDLNPSEYLQHLRIEEARKLLELSSSQVEEIAWQVGYQDPSAFRRTFRKIVGLTPREFRRKFTRFHS